MTAQACSQNGVNMTNPRTPQNTQNFYHAAVPRFRAPDARASTPRYVASVQMPRLIGYNSLALSVPSSPPRPAATRAASAHPANLKRSLCQAMRGGLTSNDTEPAWSEHAVMQLDPQRKSNAFINDSALPLEEAPSGRCHWGPRRGGAGNRVLAGLLDLELGERVSPSNTFITFANCAAKTLTQWKRGGNKDTSR